MFIGIDLIEIHRIASAINNQRFVARVYSQAEQDQAVALTSERRVAEYYAGRFAAKEAAFKALSALYEERLPDLPGDHHAPPFAFNEIQTLANASGLPHLSFNGDLFEWLKVFPRIHTQVSISHTRSLCTAIVLLHA